MDSADLTGPLTPPMANGELVFDAPWQGRVFGMANLLHQAGFFPWSEFQAALISVIGDWQATHAEEDPYPYYELFLQALLNVLRHNQCLDTVQLEALVHELTQRPHGHDH